MDFPDAHCCANPHQSWVLILLCAVVLLLVWKGLRSPRPPDWWRASERRHRK